MNEQQREDGRTSRVIISPETRRMIEWAKGVLRGFNGREASAREALDWLLRDSCEYGSPVVGGQARKVWPDSVEAREWDRKRHDRVSSASGIVGDSAHNPRHLGGSNQPREEA